MRQQSLRCCSSSELTSGNIIQHSPNLRAGNQTLNPDELAYIKNRRANTLLSSLKTWMGSNASQIYNGSLDTVEQLPTIALVSTLALTLPTYL